MVFALAGARIFTGETFIDDHAVIVDGARITAVIPRRNLRDTEVQELHGGILAPGFIDVQVNGGGGALLNDDPSVETVRTIAQSHRRFGTVGLLPTVITDAPSVLHQAADAVQAARAQAVPGVLGIHIEGPFLDPERKGAHAARFIREMMEDDLQWLTALDCGRVMLTLAPNRVSPAQVKRLADAGVLVSLGHAEAHYDDIMLALDAGARAFTHLYNAMSQLNGRDPGMVGAALSHAESFVGIIADGHHVHDAALKLAFAAKPAERMMLITDAMPSAAGGPSHFELQGRPVTVEHGRLQLSEGTLAGSNLTMDEALRYCVNGLGLDLGTALRMASLTPASFLRLDRDLGRIAAGHRASLVHLSDDLAVLGTWIDGR
jgi:N-acetylglucosamine-6-phosphate deacetylase